MTIPTLYAASPENIVAVSLDKIWIEQIEISAPSPGGDATARVRLRRFAVDSTGELRVSAESEKIEIDNLLARAESEPELADVVQRLMAYIAKAGIEQGVIAAPE